MKHTSRFPPQPWLLSSPAAPRCRPTPTHPSPRRQAVQRPSAVHRLFTTSAAQAQPISPPPPHKRSTLVTQTAAQEATYRSFSTHLLRRAQRSRTAAWLAKQRIRKRRGHVTDQAPSLPLCFVLHMKQLRMTIFATRCWPSLRPRWHRTSKGDAALFVRHPRNTVTSRGRSNEDWIQLRGLSPPFRNLVLRLMIAGMARR